MMFGSTSASKIISLIKNQTMLKYCTLIVVLFFTVFSAENSMALDKDKKAKAAKATIKTTAQCEMCKKKIEGKVTAMDGVQKATLALGNKNLKVKYEPEKVSLEQIRKTIAALGYDADDVKANQEAYKKLPSCCKLDNKTKDGTH
jgi:periplasmic mercuric ion binding protein